VRVPGLQKKGLIRLMKEHNGTEPELAVEGEEFVVRLLARSG
jgi:hypothetical protein